MSNQMMVKEQSIRTNSREDKAMAKNIKITEICIPVKTKEAAHSSYRALKRAGVGAALYRSEKRCRTYGDYIKASKVYGFNPKAYKYALHWIVVEEG